MLNKWILTSAIAGVLFTSSAFATTANGFYMGLQLGESSSDYQNDSSGLKAFYDVNSLPLASVDNDAFAGRLDLGYQFNKFIAAELGYSYLGNTEFNHILGLSSASAELRQQAADLTAKVMLPITKQFEVFALGGGAYVDGKATDISKTAKTLGVEDNGNEGSFTPTYGLGTEYDFNDHWGLDLTWRRFVANGDIERNDLYTLGASYHFG